MSSDLKLMHERFSVENDSEIVGREAHLLWTGYGQALRCAVLGVYSNVIVVAFRGGSRAVSMKGRYLMQVI